MIALFPPVLIINMTMLSKIVILVLFVKSGLLK